MTRRTPPLRALWSARTWRTALIAFDRSNGWDRGAALAFYALLSAVPLLMLLVAVADLTWTASQVLGALAPVLRMLPPRAAGVVSELVRHALGHRGVPVWSATAVALVWSASSWFRAWSRLVEDLLDVPHPRGPLRRVGYGLRMVFTWIAALVGLAALLAAPDLLHPLVRLDWLDRAFATVWAALRWPVVLAALYLAAHALLRTGGRRRVMADGWLNPAAIVVVTAWIAATWGLRAALRLAPTGGWMYGALYGLVVVSVWCWLVNMGAVLGAVFEGVALRDGKRRTRARGVPSA